MTGTTVRGMSRSTDSPREDLRRGADLSPLPVDGVVPELLDALDRAGHAVLEAEPGAGKTTRVPLALVAEGAAQRLIVLEPRRVAARAAARRLASQLGEPVGRTVGLTTRDDRQVSPGMRIEVVTEGVVLRRIQQDPSLTGVDLLVFDEFHERSLEADLALAFALEVRGALRDDLRLLVMSATIEGPRVARLLGDAPLLTTVGRSFPVDIEHRPGPVDRRDLPAAIRAAVSDLLPDGDVLVFLPGAGEIRATIRELTGSPLPGDPVVLPLYGALSGQEQDRALRSAPDGRRKVVVATDLAETSLTIEGVRGVVDAGWSREPRFDPATGMSGVVTVPASRSSAEQRAGRAGRTAPGRCIRLWPEREHLARDAQPRPAILTDDLSGTALEVAAWGAEVAELRLLDRPPTAAWQQATDTLRQLGALDATGRITEHGRHLAGLPLSPRLGQLVLTGRATGDLRLACELAAVLGDRDPLLTDRDHPSADLAARVRVVRGDQPPTGTGVRRGALRRLREHARRLARQVNDLPARPPSTGTAAAHPEAQEPDRPDRAGRLVAAAWPDRVAGLRADARGRFLLASGRGATLPDGDLLAGEPWLAVAHLDRGAEQARIHLAAAVDAQDVREVLGDRIGEVEVVEWRDGDVRAERRVTLGALVLDRGPLSDDTPARRYPALLDGLREEGLALLRWDRDAQDLQARAAFVRHHRGDPWPDLRETALLADLETTVGPFLLQARRRADLAQVSAAEVLAAQLTPQQRRELDRLAPRHLDVPSGSRLRVTYDGDTAILAVRLQELFGARATPTVLDGRVPVLLHLLSPAQRPVQVTDDLAGFWSRSYPEVRSELRGRYPKHAWPEDPTTATPLRGAKRRR